MVLAAASVLMLLVVYIVAINETIKLNRENNGMTSRIALAASAPQQIAILEGEVKSLKKMFEVLDHKKDLRKELLERVSLLCEKHSAKFIKFQDPNVYSESDHEVVTHEITLQGGYKSLLKVVNDLEHDLSIGKVTSIHFNVEEDKRTKRKYLLAYLFVQSINTQSNENIQ